VSLSSLARMEPDAIDRRTYIGGGDMGDVLSLAPYGCRYRAWLEKRGEVEPEDISGKGPVRRGVRGEEIAAEEYSRETGRRVRRYQFLRHKDFPYFGAHIDRHIVAFDERGPGVAEIKCPGEFAFRTIKREGMSEAHISQLNWYLYVTGWKWGAFAVFSLERFELVHFDVQRDDVLIERLANAAQDFHRLLENGPAPEKLDAKDKRCIRCHHREHCHGEPELPEWDGLIEYDPSLGALVADYREAQQIESEASAYKTEVGDKLRVLMSGRQCVDTDGARVYYSTVKVDSYTVKAHEKRPLRVFERRGN
jgi:putative phage-type endonuclease